MKQIITFCLLFIFSKSFCQWTKIQQVHSTNIASLYHTGNTLYAGGEKVIYISRDNGITWDSTSSNPQLFLVTSIIVYKNELYAAAPHKGVFKSPDEGRTWQNISTGIYPDVSDFCEFKGELYAATLGNSVYKLDPVSNNHWISFSNGLGSLSQYATAIAGTSTTLVAGLNNNGLYGYLPSNSTIWEERFLIPHVSVSDGAFQIITVHDTLFLAGKIGTFFISTDKGATWSLFGKRLKSSSSTIVNAKQGLISAIRFFDGGSFFSAFFYIKKDSLQNSFVNFDAVANQYTWKIDIVGNKLWAATDRGLFFMPLSSLPGITAADDSTSVILPVNFILFNAKCEGSKTLLTWKNGQEQAGTHFGIERSADGSHWTRIGDVPAAHYGATGSSYTFTDNKALQNRYYRIAAFEPDGKIQYTNVLRSSCNAPDIFSLWPNPGHDIVFINIAAANESQAMIRVFDNRGSLVKEKRVTIFSGGNQFNLDLSSLAGGIYSVSATWENGKMRKGIKLFKE